MVVSCSTSAAQRKARVWKKRYPYWAMTASRGSQRRESQRGGGTAGVAGGEQGSIPRRRK